MKLPFALVIISTVLIGVRCLGSDSIRAHGNTIIAIQYTNDRVVVAADSRENFVAGGRRDTFCKLMQLGRGFFFFATGRVIFTDTKTGDDLLNAFPVAEEAFSSLAGQQKSRHAVALIASYWGELMRERYEKLLVADPVSTVEGLQHDQLGMGVFGGSVNNELALYMVKLKYSMPPDVSAPTVYTVIGRIRPEDPPTTQFGDGEAISLILEFLANSTTRSKKANEAFSRELESSKFSAVDADALRLRFAIETASQWAGPNAKFAPPVDVLVLYHTGKLNWLKRKPQCSTKSDHR